MLLLPACVMKTFKAGKPSTSFCGTQLVNLMFDAAMDSKLMFSANSRHNMSSLVQLALLRLYLSACTATSLAICHAGIEQPESPNAWQKESL